MDKWKTLARRETVDKVIEALSERNVNAVFVENGKNAKDKVLNIIPNGSRVLTSASVTVETIGLKDEVDKGSKFVSVRNEYMALNHEKDGDKIRELRSTPDYVIGSVHAVTEDGQILVASNTGSQIGAYAYSAPHVILIVGTQKIVKNLDESTERLYKFVVPLEEKHMQDLYGSHTNVSKLLIINKEVAKDRITVIFVNEVLGF